MGLEFPQDVSGFNRFSESDIISDEQPRPGVIEEFEQRLELVWIRSRPRSRKRVGNSRGRTTKTVKGQGNDKMSTSRQTIISEGLPRSLNCLEKLEDRFRNKTDLAAKLDTVSPLLQLRVPSLRPYDTSQLRLVRTLHTFSF